jgi:hypothetical protein
VLVLSVVEAVLSGDSPDPAFFEPLEVAADFGFLDVELDDLTAAFEAFFTAGCFITFVLPGVGLSVQYHFPFASAQASPSLAFA